MGNYFLNVVWLLLEKILRLGAQFFVGIWVVRYLGAEQFGVLNYAISFVAIFSILARLGLNHLIVKELVNQPALTDVLLGTSFSLKFIGGFVVFLIMLLMAYLISQELDVILYIAIIGAGLLFQSFEVVELYFQAKVNSKPVAVVQAIQLLLSSLIKIYLINIKAELLLFVLLALIDAILVSIFYIFAYKLNYGKYIFFQFNKKIALNFLKLGWPVALSSVAMMAYTKMDQIMIYKFLNFKAVGDYAAATRVSEAWYFFPTIIVSSLYPAIVNAKNNNHELYHERLLGLFSLMVCISLAIAAPISLNADYLVRLLYGAEFSNSATVLAIHIWVGMFISLGMAASRWFILEELQRLFLVRTLTGLTLNFVLNLVLLPRYGINGAAIATLISVIFANFLSYLLHNKLRILFVLTAKSFNLFYLYRYLRRI